MSTGAGTSPSDSSADRAAVVGEHDVPPRLGRRPAPGRSSTEMQSGNGSASASSHSISVTSTAAFVGGSSKRPPEGSLEEYDVREADGDALRRDPRPPRCRSAGLRPPPSTSTSPAFSSGWSPTSVAEVAPRGRQQPASPQVQKSNRSCDRKRTWSAERLERLGARRERVAVILARRARSRPGRSGRASGAACRARARRPSPSTNTRTHARAFAPSCTT